VALYHQHAQKNKTAQQPDLFDEGAPPAPHAIASATTDPLTGLVVELPDDFCRCGSNTAIIGAGVNIHRAALRCRSCHRHRGWLSRRTADWIESIISLHGRPDKPVVIRGPRL
jgi:hypothetical protein